jgi:hypothetical protein
MSKNFETVFVQMRRPRDGDPGVTEEGRYRTEGDVVVLVDKNGNQRLTPKGKPIQRKLNPGDNQRTIAARLVREHLPQPKSDFNRRIFYPDWKF